MKLTPRQDKFIHKHVMEGLPAGVAYAEAYNRDIDDTSYTNASRLLRNAKIQETVQDLSERFKQDAITAYEIQKEMMRDPLTPAHVRSQIASQILDRAGYAATKKIEQTEIQHFKGVTDISREELKQMLT